MEMFEKLKPVKQWVKARAHNDGDASYAEIIAAAVKRFQLDEDETLALCESANVQFVRVKALLK